jgi:Spy/CpxP family protein refolding chaperone
MKPHNTPTVNQPLRTLALIMLLALASACVQVASATPFASPGGLLASSQGVDHMLDRVNATAEQRLGVQSIVQAAQKDLATLVGGSTNLRTQAIQAFTQSTVVVQQDQISKRVTQALLDISVVLTPSQRAQIGDAMREQATNPQGRPAGVGRPGR